MKLQKKKYINYSGKVYDLQVDNRHHSYTINGAVVHNSAAGCLCSYLLGITNVDPLKYGLLFERFLNEGRAKVSLPDIDTDFGGEQRPLVKEYMEQRFGAEQVCSVGTYTTFQLKAAITDLCRLEGVPVPYVKKITKRLGGEKEKTMEDFFRTACVDEELKEFTLKYYEVVNDTALILGQPKAASIHACAMMIFPDDKSMFAWVPVRKQKDMIVSEWEGGELDSAGFLKEDILGIEQLDKFQDIVDLIEKNHGKRIDLYRDIPLDDPAVYEAMGKGFLNDVFHFGAKGLSSYCVQMKPKSIEELSDCAALYRPGTIENNFHNEYLLRRSGERETEYHIGTEKILGPTQGLFCVAEGSGVYTKSGIIPIQEILPGTLVLTEDGSFQKCLLNSYNGERETIKIRTDWGEELICTKDHKVLTSQGWKEAGMLTHNDLIKAFQPEIREIEPLNMKDWLEGLFIADGHSSSTPTICCCDEKFADSLVEILKTEFPTMKGIHKIYRPNKKVGGGVWVVNICQNRNLGKTEFNEFNKFLKERGHLKKSRESKSFPEKYSFSTILGFLEGDGCFINGSCGLKYKHIAIAIHRGLLSYGIRSSFHKENSCYRFSFSPYLKTVLKTTLNKHKDSEGYIPREYIYKFRGIYPGNRKFNQSLRLSKKHIPVKISVAKEIGWECSSDQHSSWAKVLSIKDGGIKKVYDLSIENNHSFVVGGLVVHNCYQEQIMALMNELAGMDLVTCDTARRAMGKKKIDVIQSLEGKFIDGYCSRYHVSEDYAKNFWNEIVKSSSYLFNKSHSVAYSINGYNSEWLKVHYPIEFWSVAFSRAKAEDIPFFVNEIQNSGNIEVRPVDINKSTINIISDIETNSMYWAFNSVDQVGDKAQAQLLEERNLNGEYFSLEEFIDRQMFKGSPINKSVVENLIYSGAFDTVENITDVRQRTTLLEKYRELKKVKVDKTKDEYSLAKEKNKTNTAWWWKLQQKNKSNLAFFDYETLVEAYLRKSIGPDIPYISGEDLRNWKEGKEADVAIGGYVLEIQERKSKKGPFCNLVIENNYEFIKVLVYPELFEDYGDFLRESVGSLLLLNGYVTYNKFHDAYVVQTSNYTEFIKMELI
jgi:intein/homing endonuclease